MKQRKMNLIFVCLVVILVLFSGCSSKGIKGTWYQNGNPEKTQIEFKDDGKAVLMANGNRVDITYTLSEDKRNVNLNREGAFFDQNGTLTMQDDGTLKDMNSNFVYFRNIDDACKSHDEMIDERYDNAYKLITENVWRMDVVRDANNTMPECYGILKIKNNGTYIGTIYSSDSDAVLLQEKGSYQADKVEEINELGYSPDTKRIYLTFTTASIEDSGLQTHLDKINAEHNFQMYRYNQPDSFFISPGEKENLTIVDQGAYYNIYLRSIQYHSEN